jgi:hypothetical protein
MSRLATASVLLFVVISTAWATDVAEPGTQGFTVYTLSPLLLAGNSGHLQGQSMTYFTLVGNLHEMNIPGGHQPEGLQLQFLLQDDVTVGHASICKAAFQQVVSDATSTSGSNLKSTDHVAPFFQIMIDRAYSQIVTDEGASIYPDKAVSCWEVLDPRAVPSS